MPPPPFPGKFSSKLPSIATGAYIGRVSKTYLSQQISKFSVDLSPEGCPGHLYKGLSVYLPRHFTLLQNLHVHHRHQVSIQTLHRKE